MIFLSMILSPLGLIAQESSGAEGGGGFQIIGILLLFAVFFFLIILPQSRKAKKHAQFVNSLQKGDEVVTQSGIYGKIHGLAEKVVTLEVAPQVRLRVDRNTILAKANEQAAPSK